MSKFVIASVAAILLLVGGVWWSNRSTMQDPNVLSNDGLHWHPELEIYIHGEPVEIPQGIGLAGRHNPIHTHDDLPIIHMEFGSRVTQEDTRLTHFFDAWGKTFNESQILEYENGPEGMVHMFVNGEENFEFGDYHMREGDKIEIRYE